MSALSQLFRTRVLLCDSTRFESTPQLIADITRNHIFIANASYTLDYYYAAGDVQHPRFAQSKADAKGCRLYPVPLSSFALGRRYAPDDAQHARFKTKPLTQPKAPLTRPKADAKGCRLYPVHPVPLSSFALGCCYAAAPGLSPLRN